MPVDVNGVVINIMKWNFVVFVERMKREKLEQDLNGNKKIDWRIFLKLRLNKS